MSLDLYAIGTAIATRYAPANVTPPTGEPTLRYATADLPVAIGATPAIVVVSDGGTLTFGSQTRRGAHRYSVNLYIEDAGDYGRQMARAAKWASALLDVPLASVHLGMPDTVSQTWLASYEIGLLEYAGTTFVGVRLGVEVTTTDGISPVA